jgi:hypothetical protein
MRVWKAVDQFLLDRAIREKACYLQAVVEQQPEEGVDSGGQPAVLE